MAFGSGVGSTERAGDGSASQPLVTPRVERWATGTRLPGFAAFRARLGTSLVQQAGACSAVRYVSVREYAALLGVSTATVYKAVGAGEIPHVRVASVIRIVMPPDPGEPASR